MASGKLTLTVSIDGSVQNPTPGLNETKTEFAVANLEFDLADVPVTGLNGAEQATWKNAQFVGQLNWSEYDEQKFQCGSGLALQEDTVIKTFNSSSSGAQPGGVSLSVLPSGSYGITAAGAWTGQPTHQFHSTWSNCQTVTYASDSANLVGVPFEQYFSADFGGLLGSFTGQAGSDLSHISGKFDGTDQLTVFSVGTTSVTVPVKVSVVWNFTIQ